jgi:hypothetical protein
MLQPLVLGGRSGAFPRPPLRLSRRLRCWRVTGLAPTPCACTGGGCRNSVSRFRCSTRTWSQCACRMATRTARSQLRRMQAPGSASRRGAAVAVGKPPTAWGSEHASSDRHIATSGIRASSGTSDSSILTRRKHEYDCHALLGCD